MENTSVTNTGVLLGYEFELDLDKAQTAADHAALREGFLPWLDTVRPQHPELESFIQSGELVPTPRGFRSGAYSPAGAFHLASAVFTYYISRSDEDFGAMPVEVRLSFHDMNREKIAHYAEPQRHAVQLDLAAGFMTRTFWVHAPGHGLCVQTDDMAKERIDEEPETAAA